MGNSKALRIAVRSARRILASGKVGKEFREGLRAANPLLPNSILTAATERVRREAGILGHSILDPNLEKSCGDARTAFAKHPHKETILAVYRTPLCASCMHRSNGCGLIGGTRRLAIIDRVDDVSEGMVRKTASILVGNETISVEAAERMVNVKANPVKKIAALNRAKYIPEIKTALDAVASANSMRTAASLDTTGQGPVIVPVKKRGNPTARNRDYEGGHETARPGDRKAERASSRVARALQPAGTTIVPVQTAVRARRDVDLGRVARMSTPKIENPRRTASGPDEQSNSLVKTYNSLIRTARHVFARGEMTAEKAGKFYSEIDFLTAQGVRPTALDRRVTRQLSLLVGNWEA